MRSLLTATLMFAAMAGSAQAQLTPPATNVHFVDDFDGTTMVFDHRMRPGVVPRGNALALLRAAGIPV